MPIQLPLSPTSESIWLLTPVKMIGLLFCIRKLIWELFCIAKLIIFANDMHIISHKALVDFYSERFPDSKTSIEEWYSLAKKAEWKNAAEVKIDRPDVDCPGNGHFIFNICGNKYRLIVKILFQVQRIYIRFVGTHKEYDKVDCKNI